MKIIKKCGYWLPSVSFSTQVYKAFNLFLYHSYWKIKICVIHGIFCFIGLIECAFSCITLKRVHASEEEVLCGMKVCGRSVWMGECV